MGIRRNRVTTAGLAFNFGLLVVAMVLSDAGQSNTFIQIHQNAKTDEQKLSELFSFADSEKSLLTFNKNYVLQPSYGKDGDVWIIQVVPKYALNDTHPDWIEPDELPFLDRPEYSRLLSKIGQVKALGRRHNEDSGSAYVTNRQFPAIDEYDNGFVKRSMFAFAARDSEHPPYFHVASLSILFFHSVSGNLDSVLMPKLAARRGSPCEVRIDGKQYWTATTNCRSLKVNGHVSIKAAGPVEDSM